MKPTTLTLLGIVAAVMTVTAMLGVIQSVSALDINRNNVNICRNCQSGQNSGDNSLNTNGGQFQSGGTTNTATNFGDNSLNTNGGIFQSR